MRKKSKKKQIVAMTLALSVLSSSVGMCGAAAATDPPPRADGSDLQVTVVPLADSNADTATDTTPADDAKTDGDTKTEEQPAASTGDNTDQPTDGDATGDNDTSSDDKPTIERPEQSDTVETLPGSAKDNFGKKDDTTGNTEGKGDSSEETPTTGDTDTGSTEDKGEEGSGSEETPEEKPEETPEEDDTDYSCAYNEKTGRFNITFNIKEDAEGDQTIELSKVQEVVNAYGKQAIEEYLKTDEAQKKYDDYLYYKMKFVCTLPNGLQYVYDPNTKTADYYEEPSCTTVFDISLSNGSKHTYVYKNNSLNVATPDLTGKGDSGVTGFDDQELPEDITRKNLSLSVSMDASVSGCMEDLVDEALKEYGKTNSFRIDENGNVIASAATVTVSKDTPLVKLSDGKLYVKAGDYYYGGISYSLSTKTPDENGNYYLKADKTNVSRTARDENGKTAYRPVERGGTGTLAATQGEISSALRKYLQNSDTTIEQEILNYYNNGSDVTYDNITDLLANNTEAAKDLSKGGSSVGQKISVNSSQFYNNFYQNILSFNVGDKADMDKFLGNNEDGEDHGHGHGSWATDGNNMTIGDYMADKLDETPGAWDKANNYFQTLLANGMSEDQATWAAFTMAVNIDGLRADNNYQNSAWSWYASMVLRQADGTLDLTKTDADTGEIIGDDEDEGQTSFYLWKYETDKETGEKDTMYCTYVEPTYTTNEDGEQVLEKDGFYCWVKYEPAKDKLTYTVTTTNGKLNIDYKLLENVVYYLQEAIAPEGYDIDPEIYVICDEESYKALEGTEVTNPATGATSKVTESSWLGSIIGGKTLPINFMNTATVPDPDPDPTPDPDPVPPTDPDTPVDPENPDNPPVQDETPDGDTPVTPENPQNPAVQDATPDAAALPKTGTTGWMAAALASLGSLLMACGWFFTRKQYSPKH